jgi:hypothetical protein
VEHAKQSGSNRKAAGISKSGGACRIAMESSTVIRLPVFFYYTHLDIVPETGHNCFLSLPLKFGSHYHPNIDGLTKIVAKLTINEFLGNLHTCTGTEVMYRPYGP